MFVSTKSVKGDSSSRSWISPHRILARILSSGDRRLLQQMMGFGSTFSQSTWTYIQGFSSSSVRWASSVHSTRRPLKSTSVSPVAHHLLFRSSAPKKRWATSPASNESLSKVTWPSMVSAAKSLAALRKATTSAKSWNSTSHLRFTGGTGILLRSPKPKTLQSPETSRLPGGCRHGNPFPVDLHSSTALLTPREVAASSSTEVSNENSSTFSSSSLLRLRKHGMVPSLFSTVNVLLAAT